MTDEAQDQTAPELSEDAKLVAALFISKMTKAGGNRLIKEIHNSVSRLVKAGDFDRAQFALLLIDYLEPRIAEIVVKPKAKRATPKKKAA